MTSINSLNQKKLSLKFIVIVLFTFICLNIYSQGKDKPFVASINLDGGKDFTFNSPGYNTYLNLINNNDITPIDITIHDNSIYITSLASNKISQTNLDIRPAVFKLRRDGKLSKIDFGAGNGYILIDPYIDGYYDYTPFDAEYIDNSISKGLLIVGKAEHGDTKYPFFHKLTRKGFQDNFFREGGAFLDLDRTSQMVKSIAKSNSELFFSAELNIDNENMTQVYKSELNGWFNRVANDTIRNTRNAKLFYYDNYVYAMATIDKGSSVMAKDLVLVKYNNNLERDMSFGDNGVKKIKISSGSFIPSSLIIQSDKIYIGGKNGKNKIAVLKFNLDGTRDDGFAGDGIHIRHLIGSDIYYGDLTIVNNYIYVTGTLNRSWFIYTINLATGEEVPSFGVNGIIYYNELYDMNGIKIPTTDYKAFRALKITPLGDSSNKKLIVTGTIY